MLVIGPPLAAPLLFTIGYEWALLANALSFVVSFIAVRGIKPPVLDTPAPAVSEAKPSVWREFRAGLSFLRSSPVVLTLISSAVIVTIGVGALNTLDVFFVTENLHAKETFYGFLGTAEGAGLIIGSLLTGWLVGKLGGVRVFWAGLIVAGLVIIVFARQTSLIPAMVVLACGGAVMGAVNAAIGPIIMGAVPRELLGRVVAVITPLQQVASISSALLVSWLASTVLSGLNVTVGPVTFGRLDLIYTAAGFLFIVGGLYSAFILRRQPAAEPTATASAGPSVAEPAAGSEAAET
jgi:MFS family permease